MVYWPDVETLGDMARHHGASQPEKLCFDCDDAFGKRQITYGDFDRHTNQVANALIAMGLKPGDRISCLSKNSDWYFELLVGGAKLGGILIENQGEAGGACRVVIGIGLNLAMPDSAAQQIDQQWTSLTACLEQAPGRNQLAGELLAQLMTGLSDFERGGFEPFALDFRRADCLQGQAVRVEDHGRFEDGIAKGIGAQGALRFQPNGGAERLLYSGDVSVRRQVAS